MNISKGNWKVGEKADTVITDNGEGFGPYGSDAQKYYGGFLIAESVLPCNRQIIAAAPDLLEACENLENDNGSIPDHAWEMIQNAIKKARG
jgi:hypothetical protein